MSPNKATPERNSTTVEQGKRQSFIDENGTSDSSDTSEDSVTSYEQKTENKKRKKRRILDSPESTTPHTSPTSSPIPLPSPSSAETICFSSPIIEEGGGQDDTFVISSDEELEKSMASFDDRCFKIE